MSTSQFDKTQLFKTMSVALSLSILQAPICSLAAQASPFGTFTPIVPGG